MRWTTKARIQNLISKLPSGLSYATYYGLQRKFGRLREFEFPRKIRAAGEIWSRIEKQGRDPKGGVFFEVGTGWVPVVPLTFWLMGAERTITVDLNPYVRPKLVEEALQFLAEKPKRVRSILEGRLDEARYEKAISLLEQRPFSMERFYDECGIEYRAPSDASATGLDDDCIDFHVSFVVLEHIPAGVVKGIFEEGNRIVKPDGLFVHLIDYSDHFAHTDKTITVINFLQFSDEEWDRFASNRYMYMNRLRHDDYQEIFQNLGHQVVETEPVTDERAEILLSSGTFPINKRFASKDHKILAIKNSWFVSRP